MSFKSRKAVYDYLDAYSAARRDEVEEQALSRGLITSYTLEHHDGPMEDIGRMFEEEGWEVLRIGEEKDFYELRGLGENLGYIEPFSKRHLALHTTLATSDADKLIARKVDKSSHLDTAWFAGSYLQSIWQNIVLEAVPHRVTKLKFEHRANFEIANFSSEESHYAASEVDESFEQPASVSEIKERSSRLRTVLPELQDIYPPYKAIKMLRLPAFASPGGFDLWSWGKMTYRAHSFRGGRSLLQTVSEIYEKMTRFIEEKLWLEAETTVLKNGGEAFRVKGAPLTMRFNPELSPETFENFVETTFARGQGPLRLWGNPIRLGERKVHVYGIDKHLWQRVYVELTPKSMTVLLPKGTCGNTVHRLMTNIQRYVSPNVESYVGDVGYEDLIELAFSQD